MSQCNIVISMPSDGINPLKIAAFAQSIQCLLDIRGIGGTVTVDTDTRPTTEDLKRVNNFTSRLSRGPIALENHLDWINSWLHMDLTKFVLKVENVNAMMTEITIDTTTGPQVITILAMKPQAPACEEIEFIYAFGNTRQLWDTTFKAGNLHIPTYRKVAMKCNEEQLAENMKEEFDKQVRELRVFIHAALACCGNISSLFWKTLNGMGEHFPAGVKLISHKFDDSTSVSVVAQVEVNGMSSVIAGQTAKVSIETTVKEEGLWKLAATAERDDPDFIRMATALRGIHDECIPLLTADDGGKAAITQRFCEAMAYNRDFQWKDVSIFKTHHADKSTTTLVSFTVKYKPDATMWTTMALAFTQKQVDEYMKKVAEASTAKSKDSEPATPVVQLQAESVRRFIISTLSGQVRDMDLTVYHRRGYLAKRLGQVAITMLNTMRQAKHPTFELKDVGLNGQWLTLVLHLCYNNNSMITRTVKINVGPGKTSVKKTP